jgi:hypothetical protein
MEIVKLVIDALAALATVAVAAAAIWGNWLRAWLSPPKIVLRLHTPDGTPALLAGGAHARYYHLKAVNARPWLTVENCRVLLMSVRRRGADADRFTELEFPVPFAYLWSGEEPAPEVVTVTSHRVLDFGRVMDGRLLFEPRLRAVPNNFDGFVRKGEAVRYELTVEDSNLPASRPQVFEVTWGGQHPVVAEVTGNP